jgi:hypothetical protein
MLSFLFGRLLRLPAGLIRIAGPLLIVGLLVLGVIVAGRWALERLHTQDRYQFPFTEIECPAPPGRSRAEFLAEVQYLGGLPDKVSPLDRELPDRLRTAFSKHPWVEYVTRVEVRAHQVEVQLMLRRPALVVVPFNRVVDTNGVLLPKTAPTAGLPLLSQAAQPPAGPDGTRWGDPRVEAAARSMAGVTP